MQSSSYSNSANHVENGLEVTRGKDDKLGETAVIKTILTDLHKFNGHGHLEKWRGTITNVYNFSRDCRQGNGEQRTSIIGTSSDCGIIYREWDN